MAKQPKSLNGKVVAITGGARGIGKATAQALVRQGARVAIGDLDVELARQTASELGENVRAYELDVTSRPSFAAFLDSVESDLGALDVLINNAGIVGRRKPFAEITADDVELVFRTNVFGVVRVTQAFVPLLERSANPVIVNVSSGMGSIGLTSDPDRVESSLISLAYAPSKSAVNMLTTQYAKALPEIRVNAVDPGYTGTDFNANRGRQTVQEGTDAIVAMAQIGADGPTGTYVDRSGVVPW
jgi:NAD(P)-dependent dehydrogenase (short-subunit alcohol dehydrogenase family)